MDTTKRKYIRKKKNNNIEIKKCGRKKKEIKVDTEIEIKKEEKSDNCPVCLDDIDNKNKEFFECFHYICKSCAPTIFSRCDVCPVCRNPINRKSNKETTMIDTPTQDILSNIFSEFSNIDVDYEYMYDATEQCNIS